MTEIDVKNQIQLLASNFIAPNVEAIYYRAAMPKTPAVGNPNPPAPFTLNTIQNTIPANTYDAVEITAANSSDAYFLPTGAKVYSNLDFQDSDVKFPLVVFNVQQSKLIEITKVQGRDGTVKEYISDGDYAVTVEGIINGNRAYPRQAKNALMGLCKLKKSLPINSDYLTDLGIFNLVIVSYNIWQKEGRPYEQLFSLNCLSDVPVELMIQ